MQINSKLLNIGIVGKGDFTEELITNLQSKKMFGMCCGLHSHKYDELINLRNLEELKKVADAVLVFDPAYCLFENLIEIAKSCKHMFVAHTANLTKSELKKLASIGMEAGVNIQVSNKLRYLNIHDEIKDQTIEPHIIECSHYIQRSSKTENVSLIEDILLPDIDVVLSLAKSRVKHVSATGVGVLFDDPDVVNARIEFYNGCVATISASKIADKNVHKIRFFQNNFYYTLNYQNQSLRVVKGAEKSMDESISMDENSIADETNYHEMVNHHEILEKEIESFYYCIVLGSQPTCNIDDFIEARSVADKVVDQLERNFRRK